jgi:hypothetical protein
MRQPNGTAAPAEYQPKRPDKFRGILLHFVLQWFDVALHPPFRRTSGASRRYPQSRLAASKSLPTTSLAQVSGKMMEISF